MYIIQQADRIRHATMVNIYAETEDATLTNLLCKLVNCHCICRDCKIVLINIQKNNSFPVVIPPTPVGYNNFFFLNQIFT